MKTRYLTSEDIALILPDRRYDSHKGDYGRILLLCGSLGYTGAAALAAMGALRTGAGLVYLAVPESIYTIEATKLNEAIVIPLPDHNGMLSDSAIPKIISMLDKMDAVLLGPGMGQSEGVLAVLKVILSQYNGPVILDADGINMLASHKDILRGRTGPTILTPHPGEFMRLSPLDSDRAKSAAMLAQDLGVIVLLKGHQSVITDGVQCFINTTGNPGMAVGGSGDLLSGIITSLVGQGVTPLVATAAGAWLHGAAGDICAREIGQYGMLPTDMITVLPRLMK